MSRVVVQFHEMTLKKDLHVVTLGLGRGVRVIWF